MVLGNDGNEIRQIEKSPTATPAHRIKDGLRIASSKPLVNTREQTTNLAIRSLRAMAYRPMSVVSSRPTYGATPIHKLKLLFEFYREQLFDMRLYKHMSGRLVGR
jgi:hypothetical protein